MFAVENDCGSIDCRLFNVLGCEDAAAPPLPPMV